MFYLSPLGPFVPAPPEVAMRMLREQGGPPPFEGGGRNGRPGPQLGGSAPILALSSGFRQDPRRIRRYITCTDLTTVYGFFCLFLMLLHRFLLLYSGTVWPSGQLNLNFYTKLIKVNLKIICEGISWELYL